MNLSKFQQSELKKFDEKFNGGLYGMNKNEILRAMKDEMKDMLKSSIEKAYALGKEEKEKEICICAAIQFGSEIIRGHRHNDCYRTAIGKKINVNEQHEQGFMTTKNRFVDRHEALMLQKEAGIKSADRKGYRKDGLYSEDLY